MLVRATVFVGVLLFSACAVAGQADDKKEAFEIYRIAGKDHRFIANKEKFYTISENCRREKNGTFECAAYTALTKASAARVAGKSSGGADPGRFICTEVGGTLTSAHASGDDEALLCRFVDGSLVTADSLHAHGILNDKRKNDTK